MSVKVYLLISYTWCSGEPTYENEVASLEKKKLKTWLKNSEYKKVAKEEAWQNENLRRTAYIEEVELI